MGFNPVKIASIAMKAIPMIFEAFMAVERFVKAAKGKDKEDAAVEMVKELIEGSEGIIGKELADDDLAMAAARELMQAIAAAQNVFKARLAAIAAAKAQ